MKSFRPCSSGFSLVEILTVVAVIAVLAAILMAVMPRLRLSAAKAVDVNKLRQMASATLLYHSEHNELPGPLNRAVLIPSFVQESHRIRWFSTFMADKGMLPGDDVFWSPVVDYGIREIGQGYLLNNTLFSDPNHFFGRRNADPDIAHGPRRLVQLRSNINDSPPDEEPLSAIWMITNIDGENYSAASTGGSAFAVPDDVRAPWKGRNYVFFDGHVEFRSEGEYPSKD